MKEILGHYAPRFHREEEKAKIERKIGFAEKIMEEFKDIS